MTNLHEFPQQLLKLRNMFKVIEQRNCELYGKQKNIDEQQCRALANSFKVSFFDGSNRISCQMTWDDLAQAVDFKENKLKFERKPIIQKRYDKFLKTMADEGKSIYNHILLNEMKIDETKSVGRPGEFTICQNKYPYDFGTHRHFLLWIHPDCVESQRRKLFNETECNKIISDISKEYPKLLGEKFIIFRNATANKSVLTIEHFHLVFE